MVYLYQRNAVPLLPYDARKALVGKSQHTTNESTFALNKQPKRKKVYSMVTVWGIVINLSLCFVFLCLFCCVVAKEKDRAKIG